MIHECIEANRDKFVRYAKIAAVIGWVLLFISAVLMIPTIFSYGRIGYSITGLALLNYIFLKFITPAFFGMCCLLLGQFLECELGSEERPGWFFRNGSVILRVYAIVFIGIIIFKDVKYMYYFIKYLDSPEYTYIATLVLMIMFSIAKVLLLWGLATVVKLMMDEIRKKRRTGAIN